MSKILSDPAVTRFVGWRGPLRLQDIMPGLVVALNQLPQGWRSQQDFAILNSRIRRAARFKSIGLRQSGSGASWICVLFEMESGRVMLAIPAEGNNASPIAFTRGPSREKFEEEARAVVRRVTLALYINR